MTQNQLICLNDGQATRHNSNSIKFGFNYPMTVFIPIILSFLNTGQFDEETLCCPSQFEHLLVFVQLLSAQSSLPHL
jgi:hypothetical protein